MCACVYVDGVAHSCVGHELFNLHDTTHRS